MSYFTIAQCVKDVDFIDRITACVSQEPAGDVNAIPADLFWFVASRGDIEAAYASALAGNLPHPGADPAVITDGMILSAVQAAQADEP